MDEIYRHKLKAAREKFCPADKGRRQAYRESFREFTKKFFPNYSIYTVQQLESSRTYQPSKRLMVLVDMVIALTEKKQEDEHAS